MKSGLGVCVLGLLCLYTAVCGQGSMKVSCDDTCVQKAVNGAMDKLNKRLISGNKLVLFQILSASKAESGSGSVYTLQFSTRRSDCPITNSKPWTECDYLPIHKNPTRCKATVHMTQTDVDVRQVECQLGHVAPEKASCFGCEEEVVENSEDLRSALSVSITKYNSISNSTHLFNLHSVGHATRQVGVDFRFKLIFDMRKTTCAKADHKDLNELCVPDDQNVEFASCNSTVDMAPWRLEPPQANVQCDTGALPMVFSRRRPTGWTPFRSVDQVKPSPTPSTTVVKEESSEEDITASKPPASPAVSSPSDGTTPSPFHCPSKPWKPFNPASPAGPTGAPSQPAADLLA